MPLSYGFCYPNALPPRFFFITTTTLLFKNEKIRLQRFGMTLYFQRRFSFVYITSRSMGRLTWTILAFIVPEPRYVFVEVKLHFHRFAAAARFQRAKIAPAIQRHIFMQSLYT